MKSAPSPLLASLLASPVACLPATLLLATAAFAADQTWDQANADNNWNTTSTNWTGGVTWTQGNNAIFGGTAETVTLTAPIVAGGLTFNSSGYALGGGSLTLAGAAPVISLSSGSLSLNANLISTGVVSVNANGQVGFSGNNAGLGGGVVVSQNTRINTNGNSNAFGTALVTVQGDGTVNDGQIYLTGAMLLSNNFAISGRGGNSTDTVQRGALRLDSNSAVAGNVALTGNAAVGSFSGAGTVHGVISGGFALAKVGGGTVIFNGANTYTGATSIEAGVLSVRNIGNAGSVGNLGAGSVINLGAGGDNGILNYTGTGEVTNRVLNWSGTTGGGNIRANNASGVLHFTANTTTTGVGGKGISFEGAGEGRLDGSITNNGGVMNVNKNGSGTWTLGGALATGTGTLTVNGGRLNFAGSYAGNTVVNNSARMHLTGTAGAIAVNGGGVLSGTGSTAGTVTFQAGSFISLAGGGSTTSFTANGLNFAGSTQVIFDGGIVNGTTYDIASYGAGGLVGENNLDGSTYRGGFSTATPGKITLTANVGTRTWSPEPFNGAPDTVWAHGLGNFSGGDGDYFDGDSVIFGDIAADSTIDIGGTMLPGSVTVANSANTYTFTGALAGGRIAGGGSLTKNGAGTLILSTGHSYTGGTTVNGGTLRVNAGGAVGGIRGEVTVNAGGTLVGGISDSLGYNNNGTQVTVLNINGGTFDNAVAGNQGFTTNVFLTGGSITSTGGGLFNFDSGYGITSRASSTTSTISSGILLRSGNLMTVDVADGAAAVDLGITGAISQSGGDGGIVKNGNGLLQLSGINSYLGGTTVNGGTLRLAAGGQTGAIRGLATINSGARLETGAGDALGYGANRVTNLMINGGSFDNLVAGNQGFQTNLMLKGGTVTSTGGGAFNFSTGTTLTSQEAAVSSVISSRVDIRNSHDLAISVANGAATQDLVISGAIGNFTEGSGSITKYGTGTLLLNAANTFTGTATVSAGTLGGTGSMTAALTVNSGATLSPGASVESFQSGALTLNSGSTFAYEVDSSAANGVGADLMVSTGGLTLNGPVNLSFTDLALVPTAYALNTTFTLINYADAWNGGTFTYNGGSLADDSLFTAGLNTWQIDYNATAEGLNFQADSTQANFVNITRVIPEPSTALLGALGLLGLFRRRRVA